MSADATYVAKVHGDGPDKLTVESGGTIDVLAGGVLALAGTDIRPQLAALPSTTELGYVAGTVPGTVVAGKAMVPTTGKVIDEVDVTLLKVGGSNKTAAVAAAVTTPVAGVAAGYKVARGSHTQVAASDTVVSGLATVVAVVVSFKSAPTVKQLFCSADIGNQSGAPAAGSFLLKTWKPTAVNDVTPAAATDFSENLAFDWVAIGT